MIEEAISRGFDVTAFGRRENNTKAQDYVQKDLFDLTADEKSEYRLKDVTTDENGFYYFKGVLAGNYVVRFKYGNKEAGVNYKIQQCIIN